jgi:hypothetical protein
MKKVLFVVLIILLISGCTSSLYKEEMKNGNDAFINKDFDLALSSYENAAQEEHILKGSNIIAYIGCVSGNQVL